MTEKPSVKPRASAKAAIPTVASSSTDWNALLDQFAAGDGEVLFIKKRVRVRLAPFEDPNRIFIPVKNIYRGKVSTKYMVKVLYLEASEGSSPYRALLLSKRDIRMILQLQMEGWELFDAEAGHAISLTRTGSGTDSQVSVSPSPKVRPITEEELTELEEFDIDAAGARYSKAQEDRAAAGGNGPQAEEDDEGDYN